MRMHYLGYLSTIFLLINVSFAENNAVVAAESDRCIDMLTVDDHGAGPDVLTSAENCFKALDRLCGAKVTPVTIYHRSTHYYNDTTTVYTYCYGPCRVAGLCDMDASEVRE